MRTDLNMRKGKMIAQGAHASMKAILDIGNIVRTNPREDDRMLMIDVTPDFHSALFEWLEGRFTKVCVGVNSEEELLEVYNNAVNAGIECRALIEDAGLTEFGGVKTLTCCAIGPAYPEQLNPITGHLKLL